MLRELLHIDRLDEENAPGLISRELLASALVESIGLQSCGSFGHLLLMFTLLSLSLTLHLMILLHDEPHFFNLRLHFCLFLNIGLCLSWDTVIGISQGSSVELLLCLLANVFGTSTTPY